MSRWVNGYVHLLRQGEKFYPPAIKRTDEEALTFGDLVELLYVREFRDRGVGLGEIVHTADEFRREWSTQYPFATKRFATDGQGLLLQRGTDWEHALTGQKQAFFEELGMQLVHIGDLAAEWRPLGTSKSILLSPDRAFGKPIEDGSGAHTHVLSQAYEASHDANSVGWWYGISAKAVLDAVQFEKDFHLECHSETKAA